MKHTCNMHIISTRDIVLYVVNQVLGCFICRVKNTAPIVHNKESCASTNAMQEFMDYLGNCHSTQQFNCIIVKPDMRSQLAVGEHLVYEVCVNVCMYFFCLSAPM